MRAADVVVTLGREAQVDEVPGTRLKNWDADEPSERGIEGMERMRLVRDARRVDGLRQRLLVDMDLERLPTSPERSIGVLELDL